MTIKFQALCLSLALLSASCGGGGAASGSSSVITGVAIDGNLYLATACLDVNVSGVCDAGEPSATTDLNGVFTIKSNLFHNTINQYPVVVMAIAGTTIDQDLPGAPVASNFTMTAPAGYPLVVSPLTTLISAKMAGGMTLGAAKQSVQADLGLVDLSDVFKNYVAQSDAKSHYMAVAVAEVLKLVDPLTSLSTQQFYIKNTVTAKITSPANVVTDIQNATSLDDARTIAQTSIAAP